MNNLLQPTEKKSFLQGRKKWYALGIFTVLFVVYQIVWHQSGGGKTPRQLEYSEGMKTPASPPDSALLLLMYSKLNAVYDQIKAVDIDSLVEFNNLDPKTLPADFQPKLITFELLDYTLDPMKAEARQGKSYQSGLGYDSFFHMANSTMGNGDFTEDFSTREFQKGFASDARYMFDDRYIMVLVSFDLVQPSTNPDGSTFSPGSYYGGVMVFDLDELKMVAYEGFVTSNSDEVTSNKYIEGEAEKSLMENLESNIKMHVNDISSKFFSKPLWLYS